MRVNKKIINVILGGAILTLTGCGNASARYLQESNSVAQVLEEQMENEEENEKHFIVSEDNSDVISGKETYIDEIQDDLSSEGTSRKDTNSTDIKMDSEENIDYDLTKMNSDMVYAIVYQLMVNPDEYIGKHIKVQGVYSPTYYEPTSQYYHYVVITDAMACCAQGIEFVWDDGSHIYPDEYPKEEAEIEVEGIFETYQDEGDPNLYCRLKEASLKVLD